MSEDEELRRKAKIRAEEKLGFYVHFGVYVGVNVMLVFVWWFTGGYKGEFPWFVFPLGGWGIGVLGHYLSVFARTGVTDRMAEKEFRKLKEEQGQQ